MGLGISLAVVCVGFLLVALSKVVLAPWLTSFVRSLPISRRIGAIAFPGVAGFELPIAGALPLVPRWSPGETTLEPPTADCPRTTEMPKPASLLLELAEKTTKPRKEMVSSPMELVRRTKETVRRTKKMAPPAKEMLRRAKEMGARRKEMVPPTKEMAHRRKEMALPDKEMVGRTKEMVEPAKETTQPAKEMGQPRKELVEPAKPMPLFSTIYPFAVEKRPNSLPEELRTAFQHPRKPSIPTFLSRAHSNQERSARFPMSVENNGAENNQNKEHTRTYG